MYMHCNDRPDEENLGYEVKNLKGGDILHASGHGWQRLIQCATWGHHAESAYAIGLQTLWGPRDGRPLW